MRGKRSKQYRKLMRQYGLAFGFREPYQVLVDAEMVQDSIRFKMNLAVGLERTLHGKVKPMITQCSIRHLYASKDNTEAVDLAKTYERRRCNHHTLENPLSTLECFRSILDPKQSSTNKHRYVVASQNTLVRAHMRTIPGVPLVYINRSVMIMEPMAEVTESLRQREEKSKFRAGLKSRIGGVVLGKRSRESDDSDLPTKTVAASASTPAEPTEAQKKRKRGPKGPNPLSVKKPKKRDGSTEVPWSEPRNGTGGSLPDESMGIIKAKRKRKPSTRNEVLGLASAED